MSQSEEKELEFVNNSYKFFDQGFSQQFTRKINLAINDVCRGKLPGSAKILHNLYDGVDVIEIILRKSKNKNVSMYLASLEKKVYLLHIFYKNHLKEVGDCNYDRNIIIHRCKKAFEKDQFYLYMDSLNK